MFDPRSKQTGRVTGLATCRSRFGESRRWSPTIRVFSRDKSILDGRRRRRRVGLNSSGNGEASASRFSVSIALRQMEMPPSTNLSCPAAFSSLTLSLSLFLLSARSPTRDREILFPHCAIDLSTCYRKHCQPWPTDSTPTSSAAVSLIESLILIGR